MHSNIIYIQVLDLLTHPKLNIFFIPFGFSLVFQINFLNDQFSIKLNRNIIFVMNLNDFLIFGGDKSFLLQLTHKIISAYRLELLLKEGVLVIMVK